MSTAKLAGKGCGHDYGMCFEGGEEGMLFRRLPESGWASMRGGEVSLRLHFSGERGEGSCSGENSDNLPLLLVSEATLKLTPSA